MTQRKRTLVFLVITFVVFLTATVAHADALDDAGAKLGSFLTRAGLIATGLIPGAGGLAIMSLSIQRKVAKAAGQQDVVNKTSEGIMEVLKLTMVGAGASILVAVAGGILK
ncbi:MAG TPA: hypothetical protein VD902_11550 [Symbiobacteriaceae bacterium]|nr:hypothetical protein [Symbiobacteriaceae bacterium]